MSVIKKFSESFLNCPKCNELLLFTAKQKDSNSHKFTVSMQEDSIDIRIDSKFFVNSWQQTFTFSISISNGSILSCNQTSQFVSLYELDIIISKSCKNCQKQSPPEVFHQSINLFYDRNESTFVAEEYNEFFSFSFDNEYYYFSNSYKEGISHISILPLDKIATENTSKVPHIQFEKFDFTDKAKIANKMKSLLLLI